MAIQVYPSHVKAENNLKALEALRQTPPNELRNKYHLLLNPTLQYRVASRYYAQEQVGWDLTKKWDMYKFFDRALKNCVNQESLNKILKSIDVAIIDQRRIVYLKTAYSVLSDASRPYYDKANALQTIRDKDPSFYENFKNALWVGCGSRQSAGIYFADNLISSNPSNPIILTVIKKMLSVMKEGYVEYNPAFYKDLR